MFCQKLTCNTSFVFEDIDMVLVMNIDQGLFRPQRQRGTKYEFKTEGSQWAYSRQTDKHTIIQKNTEVNMDR